MTNAAPKRCAIYTRKSTDEGLDQSFNSLHAQREACEAFVLSQAGEGWEALPEVFDDPAYSGGNMDRPALQRLLSNVQAGEVDVIVVYKVDRLTRSLADFAKIVEVLDQSGASFVSVTQAFNTTSSMGRLTLNVLLSFAQFEREVTGERIRDKIAASKAKGLWMGGNPPLGYDPINRELVVNEREAETVRHIFTRYLALKSVHALEAELRAAGVKSKAWVSSKGAPRGGLQFSRGALFHLLRNPAYIGRIPHKTASYPGRHATIVDAVVFASAQRQLEDNRVKHRDRPMKGDVCALKGKLFNDAGELMSPVVAYGRTGKAFRYYVSTNIQRGRRSPAKVRRLSASAADDWMTALLLRLFDTSVSTKQISRVEVYAGHVTAIVDCANQDMEDLERLGRSRLKPEERLIASTGSRTLILNIPGQIANRGGGSSIEAPQTGPAVDRRLVQALIRGHELLQQSSASPSATMQRQSAAKALSDPYEQALAKLAFLAPDIQEAIITGRQPRGMKLTDLIKHPPPLSWDDQRARFGFKIEPLAATG